MKRLIQPALALFLLALISPSQAFAYIDPGSGSYFFQLAAAALFGGLYAIKIFWRQILSFFTRLFSPRNKNKKRS